MKVNNDWVALLGKISATIYLSSQKNINLLNTNDIDWLFFKAYWLDQITS
jgi:hypothetical protein